MHGLSFNQPYFAFDIETIPDVATLRRRRDYPASVSDNEVVAMEQRLLRQRRASDFLPYHLHRIAVISGVLRKPDGEPNSTQIFSLPQTIAGAQDAHAAEAEAIRMFYGIIDKYKPQLISWNGSGFDLPIIAHRALQHGISSAWFWTTDGMLDKQFKFNNYLARYHDRHLDLMDVLGFYQSRGGTPLDEVAQCCGLPGKIGIGGAQIWNAWQENRQQEIRDYCETDALLTYLLGIRFQHLRGLCDADGMAREYHAIANHLRSCGDRWEEFLAGWTLPPLPTSADAPATE